MKINKAKCTLTGINLCNATVARLAGQWGCSVGEWPTTYLGLPLGGNPRSIAFWDPVVEKVERRVQNWKKACLSKGGRLTLIQAVLCSLPSYYMSLFRMPIAVVNKVERLIRGFLWEGFDNKKADSLVNWKTTGRSKELGGLGVGNLKEKNEALRAKWLWRFPMETGALWHKVIKSKYGIDANGWDSKSVPVGSCRNPWRDISDGYSSFVQCCRFVVGNGEKVRFWEDPWLKEGILRDLFPRLYRLSCKHSLMISAFVEAGASPHTWDLGFRRSLNEPEVSEVMRLLPILDSVCLKSTTPDGRRWMVGHSGVFSCKSYRKFLLKSVNLDPFPPFHQIWKAMVPPKVKVLVWLVAVRKVNTADRLQQRRPKMCLSPSWCTLCKRNWESTDHVFIHCPYTIRIWWELLSEVQVAWVTPKGCYELLATTVVIRGKRKKASIIWGCLVHAVIWNIWLERNRRIFDDRVGSDWSELWERVKFGAALWASTSPEFKDYHYTTIMNNFLAVLV